MKHKEFEYLVEALCSLPSISKKSAKKIAFSLLRKDDKYFDEFIKRLIDFKKNIKFCSICNNIADNSLLCSICNNENRDKNKLCIVSSIESLEKIEESNSFFGIYYVLDESQIQNKTNHTFLSKIEYLINYFNTKEILIATDMTRKGHEISNLINKFLYEKKFDISIYRIAIGIPSNAALDYMDWESLKHAIENKRKIN